MNKGLASKHLVITYPLSLGVPGGGTVGCIQIARHIRARGVDVTIVSVHSDGARGGFERNILPELHGSEQTRLLEDSDIQVVSTTPSKVHYSLDGLPVRSALKKIHAEQPVDAVIGWHHELLWSFGLLRRRGIRTGMITAAPSYAEFNGRWALTRGIRKKVIHACLKRVDFIFPPSEYIRSNILAHAAVDPAKIHVSNWGVDRNFLDSTPQPGLSPFRMIFFGWWIQEKGIFDLLEALGPVRTDPWQLTITGWGDEAVLRQAIEKNGLTEKVVTLGRLSHAELIHELERSNLAILPSYVESFGLAVAEAQASGVPVLAYAAGAVPEIIRDGETGWLVPTRDISGMRDKINQALSDPLQTRLLGLNGRKRVLENFVWEKTAARILAQIL